MDVTQIRWHQHFNWRRIFTIGFLAIGIFMLCVTVYNATGIHANQVAMHAAEAGADPVAAAAAAGPADNAINWMITYVTATIGVLSTILGMLKSWQSTVNGSAIARMVTEMNGAPEMQEGETVDVLLIKLRQALKNEAAANLSALAEQTRSM